VLRFCSLGSGSGGNAFVVEARDGGGDAGATRVLVDNGFGPRLLARKLARAGLDLDGIDAIIVTHEHSDHVGGVPALLRRRDLPLFASRGTALAAGFAQYAAWRCLRAEVGAAIGALALTPFAVSHDAREPLQFVFSDGARRLGVATDLGEADPIAQQALNAVDALVLECNHDADLLAHGAYPPFLKRRIAGAQGHLSNDQAAALLARLDRSRLRCVAAAHLSQQNNRPQLARAALARVLDTRADEVIVATQAEGFGWLAV
jgi:phosphoribosyl 1,2-cyclic phosphodiesterase